MVLFLFTEMVYVTGTRCIRNILSDLVSPSTPRRRLRPAETQLQSAESSDGSNTSGKVVRNRHWIQDRPFLRAYAVVLVKSENTGDLFPDAI